MRLPTYSEESQSAGKDLPGGGEEVMPERRIVLSKDIIEFLETWKAKKQDHLQKEGIFNGEGTHR